MNQRRCSPRFGRRKKPSLSKPPPAKAGEFAHPVRTPKDGGFNQLMETKYTRVQGIDSIRFVAAFIVLLGHFPILPQAIYHTFDNPLYRLIGAGFGLLFNGPAAVIVFFVVSGFCIHYPFRHGGTFLLGEFYARRAIRLCLPALIATALYHLAGYDISYPEFGVLWSVICEAIYYALYPLLRRIRRIISWENMIATSFAISFLVCIFNLDDLRRGLNSYVALGLLTWIVGLPCWMLGCWLAENFQKFRRPTTHQIVMLRLSVLLASFVLRLAKFHGSGIVYSNVFTLNVFSLLVVIWLGQEIQRYSDRRPPSFLEAAGTWSYSLYLIHPIIITIFGLMAISLTDAVSLLTRILVVILCLVMSYLFFRVVELPAHKLSAYVGRQIRSKTSQANSRLMNKQP